MRANYGRVPCLRLPTMLSSCLGVACGRGGTTLGPWWVLLLPVEGGPENSSLQFHTSASLCTYRRFSFSRLGI